MKLLDELFRSEAMNLVFSDESTIQSYLQFEAALARAEAQAGLIPDAASRAISAKCRVDSIDLDALSKDAARAGNLAIPLIRQLTTTVAEDDKDAAAFVHFGATSQDVLDTGMVLQMRRGFELIDQDFARLISTLRDLARTHRNQPVMARTWMQQALPTTFGFIVAGWLDAILRHRARLAQARQRVLVLQFGGAVGTLAALGGHAAGVAKALSEELHLPLPSLPWHTQQDRFAEAASLLGLYAGTLGKIAQDIALHSQTELGELREPDEAGRGSSSSMPHKQNPVTSAVVLSAAKRVPGLVSTMLHCLVEEQQRGLGSWHAEWETLPEIFRLTGGALHHLTTMLPGLVVDTARMQKNIEATNGLIFAEAVSAAISGRMGKMPAHMLLEGACKEAVEEKRALEDVLREEPRLQGYLTPADLQGLFDTRNYLGSSGEFVDRVLAEATANSPSV